MKTLDILILADRNSSLCRAYLTYLRAAGYLPSKILLIDFLGESKKSQRIKSLLGNRVSSMLVRMYRTLAGLGESSHWLRLVALMNARFDNPVSFTGRFNYSLYTKEIESVVATGFDDPDLIKAVSRSAIKTLLYTGGGMVRKKILALPDINIIHIHPGIVPEIRGADGLLWSTLIRQKIGYSGFFMSSGIDSGDVVIRCEYKLPVFSKRDYLTEFTHSDLYKALLFAYDAHMRSETLLRLLRQSEERKSSLADIPSEPQNITEGRVYFFMHKSLRDAALESMCN